MKLQTLILTLVGVGLLMGCGAVGRATPIDGRSDQPGSNSTSSAMPAFYVLDDDLPVAGLLGSFCWADGCTASEAVPAMADWTSVGMGEPIQLQLDAPLPDSLYLGLSEVGQPPGSAGWMEVVPAEPQVSWLPEVGAGDYVLMARGDWDEGGNLVTYYFRIRIGDSGAGSEPAMPGFYLLDGDLPVEGLLGSFCWAATCVDLEYRPTVTYFVPIGAGEPIRIQLDEPLPETLFLGLSSGRDTALGSAEATELVPTGPLVLWMPQTEPGDYTLLVQGVWPDDGNDVAYYFGVQITGPAGD